VFWLVGYLAQKTRYQKMFMRLSRKARREEAVNVAEIKTIKDLKREIARFYYKGPAAVNSYLLFSGVMDRLDLFEARLRKQIEVLENVPAESVRHVRAQEIRAILGDEGGGTADV